jgi:predicted HAD superfamily Cof-like phosphohydrolase
MSEISRTIDWFIKAGQMAANQKPDPRQTAFYLGMQVEELAEKLTASGVFTRLAKGNQLEGLLTALAAELKTGGMDDVVKAAFIHGRAVDMLDADMDLIWVSIGAAAAQGADPVGAYAAVTDANWAKFPGGVVTKHPVTGKVIKPEGWTPPNLTPHLHSSLAKVN